MENIVITEVFNAVETYGLIKVIHRLFGNKARIKVGFTQEVCDTPIEELSLSVRGFNVLKRSNLNTIGDIIDAIGDNRLMTLRNLGQKTLREIKAKTVNFGYDALSEKEKKEFLLEIIRQNT